MCHRRGKAEEPIMKDHSEEERMPREHETLPEAIVLAEMGAGMVTPSQEAALPNGARVIDKTPPEDSETAGTKEDPRKA